MLANSRPFVKRFTPRSRKTRRKAGRIKTSRLRQMPRIRNREPEARAPRGEPARQSRKGEGASRSSAWRAPRRGHKGAASTPHLEYPTPPETASRRLALHGASPRGEAAKTRGFAKAPSKETDWFASARRSRTNSPRNTQTPRAPEREPTARARRGEPSRQSREGEGASRKPPQKNTDWFASAQRSRTNSPRNTQTPRAPEPRANGSRSSG